MYSANVHNSNYVQFYLRLGVSLLTQTYQLNLHYLGHFH